MKEVRCIRIRLKADEATELTLSRTVATYTDAFNVVCAYGYENEEYNGVELHKATYAALRASLVAPSQLMISARMKATEALKSVREIRRKGGKVGCPESSFCPPRYDARSYKVWFDRSELSLSTVDGRKRFKFTLPKYYQSYATWKTTSADLCRDRKHRWWLHVVVQREVEEPISRESGTVRGLDLGIVQVAVDDKGNRYGEKKWRKVEERYRKITSQLQAKGTKSAKRHLKRLSGRRGRFRRDCDHVVSKQLVSGLVSGDMIAFEDLKGIRKANRKGRELNRRLHGWSFDQLQLFTTYKALGVGVEVVLVNPRWTSQACSECGLRRQKNRVTRDRFECSGCGYVACADHNAARNIRALGLKEKGSRQPAYRLDPTGSGTSPVL